MAALYTVANSGIDYGPELRSLNTIISSSTGYCALETDGKRTVRLAEDARETVTSRDC